MDRLPRIHISDRGAAIILAIVAFALYANTLGRRTFFSRLVHAETLLDARSANG